MMLRIRRLASRQRTLGVLLLLLALVMRPALVLAAEIHDAGQHVGDGIVQVGDHVEHSHSDDSMPADASDAGSQPHCVLHAAQCCGQSMPLGMADVVVEQVPAIQRPPIHHGAVPRLVHPDRALRPPIAG